MRRLHSLRFSASLLNVRGATGRTAASLLLCRWHDTAVFQEGYADMANSCKPASLLLYMLN